MDQSRLQTGGVWLAVVALIAGSWVQSAAAKDVPTEKQLLETLHTGAPADKAIACKQLAIYGSKAAVPELAKLLSDRELASWARIALEANPDPSADAALVEATKSLKGKLLVGTINSIGVRRSPEAIDALADCISDADSQVACASAVALGKIGGERAVHVLHQAYDAASPELRSAIAEGGILIAERLLAEGENDRAAALYDLIRGADIPQQRVLEATRGAIVARGDEGVPLLIEQLQSPDPKRLALGLKVARELKSNAVAEALATELATAKPARAALIVVALGDRSDSGLPDAVLQAADRGDKAVRVAALQVIGRKGDVSNVAKLVELASSSDTDVSQAAEAAIASLPDSQVNADLTQRLPTAQGQSLATLIEIIGLRRVEEATPELVKALKNSDKAVHSAALAALGASVGPKDLKVLVSQLTAAKNANDAAEAERALQTACIRMRDREATSGELAAAMNGASTANKASIVRVLGAMGGEKALATIATAAKSSDAELQDVGTRVLGEWMTTDAGPVLLDITKSPIADKYRVRALRGYLRIARQQKMSDAERIAMVRQGLALAKRGEERELALDALKRCPSAESIKLASALLDDAEVRDQAVETAIFIGEKIKDQDPAAAKTAAEKALKVAPPGKLADRARALTDSQ